MMHLASFKYNYLYVMWLELRELKFSHDHVDLRSHMLVFAHCPESSSCINCKTFYQKNPQS